MKKELRDVLLDPKAKKVENKYKAIRLTLHKLHPLLVEKLTPEQILVIIEDTVALDRYWRMATQGEDKEKKQELSQQWQLNNGYDPHYYQDKEKLSKL